MAPQGSIVSLLRATQDRLAGDHAPDVVAAFLDMPKDDIQVIALTIFFGIAQTYPGITGHAMLELAIAQAYDVEGNGAVADDPKTQEIADYIVGHLDKEPEPIPGVLFQHLVASYSKLNKVSRFDSAKHLRDTYEFTGLAGSETA